jgi:riboflavin synthase
MFTGIIEGLGKVKSAQRTADSMLLSVDLGSLAADCKAGDSIAVNGVCLTVTSLEVGIAGFDISGETLARSTLRNLTEGSLVNVERAMKADGRFGGHFVQGHIDGTAKIEKIDQRGQFWQISFAAAIELLGQMVPKGSVAVDGISLTIANMDNRTFSIAVIPETLKRTTLGKAKVGDEVNIEIDIMVKIVKQQLGNILPSQSNLTMDKLQQLGF